MLAAVIVSSSVAQAAAAREAAPGTARLPSQSDQVLAALTPPPAKPAPGKVTRASAGRDASELENWALMAGGLGMLAFLVRRRLDD